MTNLVGQLLTAILATGCFSPKRTKRRQIYEAHASGKTDYSVWRRIPL